MSEQRDSSRLRYERRAWCDHQAVTLYLTVSNVSRGGLFLRTSMPLLPGDCLEVSIEGIAGERIVAEVQIVWACRDGRGSGQPRSGVRVRIRSRGSALSADCRTAPLLH
jgi:hypothetical protein